MITVAQVESAFQLLSLQEGVHADLVPVPDRLLVRGTAQGSPLIELLDASLRDAVEPAPRMPITPTTDIRGAHLVLGDPFSRHAQLALLAQRPSRVTLLDDGASTIHLARVLTSAQPRAVERSHDPRVVSTVLGRIVRRNLERRAVRSGVQIVLGIPVDKSVVHELSARHYRIAHHRFEWSRSAACGIEDVLSGDGIVVLGSALVNDGHLTAGFYRDWLSKRCGSGVTFIPHRRERSSDIDFVRASGAAVRSSELPIELLVTPSSRRRMVHCLPSTPALTLPIITGDAGALTCDPIPIPAWCDGVPSSLVALTDEIERASSR